MRRRSGSTNLHPKLNAGLARAGAEVLVHGLDEGVEAQVRADPAGLVTHGTEGPAPPQRLDEQWAEHGGGRVHPFVVGIKVEPVVLLQVGHAARGVTRAVLGAGDEDGRPRSPRGGATRDLRKRRSGASR